MMKYGLYIPLACVAVFFLWGLYTDGTEDWVNQLLTNALVIGLGGQLLGFAVEHIFKADVIAEQIGWKKGSPFQLEVGIANLAIGVLGVVCAWFSGAFWLARYSGYHLALGMCGRSCAGHDTKQKFLARERRVCILLGAFVPCGPDRPAIDVPSGLIRLRLKKSPGVNGRLPLLKADLLSMNLRAGNTSTGLRNFRLELFIRRRADGQNEKTYFCCPGVFSDCSNDGRMQ